MDVCKEKPESLAPLHILGLEPGEAGATPSYPGGARASGRRVNLTSGTPGKARQNSVGLGLGNTSLSKGGFSMGSFQARPSPLGDSQARFEASTPGARGPGGIPPPPGASGRLTPMTQSASQEGAAGPGGPRQAKRTRSQRGNNRNDSMRQSGSQTSVSQIASLEPVAPLEPSENRWVAGSMQKSRQLTEAHALVEHKVQSLLNKLTVDKFDSISDQIIEYVNKSENRRDGAILKQVVKLIFESAKNGTAFSEIYARLCRKMAERMSPNVQDETIRSAGGQPIMGGMLFRKYLLNRCQEDFERGWSAKEAPAALAAGKAGDDKAAEATSQANGEAAFYSEGYYTAAKTKRQGLGLVWFIGELFKLQMLTERIMHECIKKFLSNTVNPEEEEIESLCKLLTIVGHSLDNARTRNHMDIYFERMQEMARGSNINSRMQYMLQDVIELRSRHWQTRAHRAPSAGAGQHSSGRDNGSSNVVQRGGSRRGEHRGDHGPQIDGWNVPGGPRAARRPAKEGDLSQFGKIAKPPSTLSFGPSSVFSKKNSKREASLSRASSSAKMFSAVGSDGPPPTEPAAARCAGSRKPSVEFGPGGAPAVEGGRKRLNLLPRRKPEAD
ncbi:ARM repeat-containing protein [Ceratobasidium sp. AG-I]|nr:ARM repeat-containing protein [Ceratobasidium sp. AG-I]